MRTKSQIKLNMSKVEFLTISPNLFGSSKSPLTQQMALPSSHMPPSKTQQSPMITSNVTLSSFLHLSVLTWLERLLSPTFTILQTRFLASLQLSTPLLRSAPTTFEKHTPGHDISPVRPPTGAMTVSIIS